MLKSMRALCVLVMLAPASGQAARFDCPNVPLAAVDPKSPEVTWGVLPSAPTSLEFSEGRLVCRYGKTVMSLELTPKQCAVQAAGGRVIQRDGITSCVFRANAAATKDQCYLECE